MARDQQALLEEVRWLLERGQAENALEILGGKGAPTPDVLNARGVCLLRLGRPEKAVEIYRNLVVVRDSILLRTDVPTAYKTNFATALLMEQNVAGCLSVLDEMRDEANPTVARLRETIERWRRSLSLPRRIWYALCGNVGSPRITLDFPPGEIPRAAPHSRAA